MLTQEQKELRKNYIGGSDLAAIAGISKYRTAVDVYLEKLGLVEEQEESVPMYWGNRLESIIRDEYERVMGIKVQEVETLFSKDHPFMIANVDGFAECEGIVVECKNVNAFRASEFGATGTDEMPDDFILQCAHYAIVTNCLRVDLAVLLGGNDFRIYHYNRNPELEAKIIEIERNFWENHVAKKVAPEPRCYRDVLNLWPKSNDEEVMVANDNIKAALDKLKEAKNKIKELENEEEKYKVELCTQLGDASILVDELGNKLATWRTGKNNNRTLRLSIGA